MPQFNFSSSVKSEPTEIVRENFSIPNETSIVLIKQEKIDDGKHNSSNENESTNHKINENTTFLNDESEVENNGAGSKLKNTRKLPLKRTKKQKLVGKKKTQYSSEIDEEELNQRTFENSRKNDSQLCTDAIDSDITTNQTFYTCKLCKKDFSSAFILCLHLQIHEKVGSVQIIETNDNAQSEDASESKNQLEENTDCIKKEICEKVNNFTGTCSSLVNESGVYLEKNESVDFINKNFVENLKKNLSLAMNRKL